MKTGDPIQITRRDVLRAMPALALVPRFALQTAGAPPIRVIDLNHVTTSVSDVKRSLDFYQGLFGMGIAGRQGPLVSMKVGSVGLQRFAISPGGANAPRSIGHYCLGVEGFVLDRILATLAAHGVTKPEAAGRGGAPAGGPMTVRVRLRGPENGGAPDGTPELYVTSPDNLSVQLQDQTYCGGAGTMGNVCMTPEAAPTKGALAVHDMRQVAFTVTNLDRELTFYQDLFAMKPQSRQAASATFQIGSTAQTLRLTQAPGPAHITHVCLAIENFSVDAVQKALATFGVRPSGAATPPTAPLTYSTATRTQLFMTDPDGILLQLLDAREATPA